jgi:hypothetical protein
MSQRLLLDRCTSAAQGGSPKVVCSSSSEIRQVELILSLKLAEPLSSSECLSGRALLLKIGVLQSSSSPHYFRSPPDVCCRDPHLHFATPSHSSPLRLSPQIRAMINNLLKKLIFIHLKFRPRNSFEQQIPLNLLPRDSIIVLVCTEQCWLFVSSSLFSKRFSELQLDSIQSRLHRP